MTDARAVIRRMLTEDDAPAAAVAGSEFYAVADPKDMSFSDDAWVLPNKKIIKVNNRQFHPHAVWNWYLDHRAYTPLAKSIIKRMKPDRRARSPVVHTSSVLDDFRETDLIDMWEIVDTDSEFYDEVEVEEEADEYEGTMVGDFLGDKGWDELWGLAGLPEDDMEFLTVGRDWISQFQGRMNWRGMAMFNSWVRVSGGEGAQIADDEDQQSVDNLRWYYNTALADVPDSQLVRIDYSMNRGEQTKAFTVGEVRNLTTQNFHREFATNIRQFLSSIRGVMRNILTERRSLGIIRPNKLDESPQSYLHVGHGKGTDAWIWDAGRLRVASDEGVEPSKFHNQIYKNQGAPDFGGRYDPVKQEASITSWGVLDDPMVERKAKVVVRRLTDRFPDVEAIWYFSGQTRDRPGQRVA